MSLVEEQWKFMQDLITLLEYIKEQGFIVTGGELWRPPFTQEYYIKIGRSKTMNSMHLKRLAIDLNFFKPIPENKKSEKGVVKVGDKYYQLTWKYEDIEPFGVFWESLDSKNRWGGHFKSFKDLPHFERRIK